MTVETLRTVEAETLRTWLDRGEAVLIDVREPDEYAREHIPGARLVPLSGFNPSDLQSDPAKIGVFHCGSGARTANEASRIIQTGFGEVYQLSGGIQGWKQAGLPVNFNSKAPISLMRQVQITAGSLIVLGVILAIFVSPWFMALSGFVGAGLVFAGLSGTCAMANLLALMPWNRQQASTA